ncbi:MAG: hypothetical protein MUC60_18955 [Oscillatoria sp. Prado101]|nr:hypothetical protein [Oscillatoria sp. Prado101]
MSGYRARAGTGKRADGHIRPHQKLFQIIAGFGPLRRRVALAANSSQSFSPCQNL